MTSAWLPGCITVGCITAVRLALCRTPRPGATTPPDLAGNRSMTKPMSATGAGPGAKIELSEVESAHAWLRLAAALALGTIGSIGMWSFVVALPAVQSTFGIARG